MTIKQYIRRHINILKQLGILNQLSFEELSQLKSCTTEIQVDNMMVTFRHRYL